MAVPEELHPWIRLTKTGASARLLNRLVDRMGGPEQLFAASAEELAAAAGCRIAAARRLLDSACQVHPRDLRLMEQLGVALLPRTDPAYPRRLLEIVDPPPALYVRGTLQPRDERAVAIVGSRRASEYGRRIAARLAEELAGAGYTIVSGLALGIDTAAHSGALKAGGRTLACLGCGVDVVYPSENRGLAEQIVQSGALLSEYPPTAPPDAWHFPSRNRVISGLSLGVVVVECPEKSGALITATIAAEQGREVFAVPGNIDNYRNRGPHRLLREGAQLVETVDDILAELEGGFAQRTLDIEVPPPAPPTLTGDERQVFDLLAEEPKPVDDLILESSLPASAVNATLLMLEMKGVARRLPGNLFHRVG